MDEEAAAELVRWERHPLGTSPAVGAIVFVFEGDAVAFERDQPAGLRLMQLKAAKNSGVAVSGERPRKPVKVVTCRT